ncbi:hypothetical protein HGM15179_016533 [Zosterops borbonicus]|uniref:Uncharacterized protein n=1 Tax=Zosterops borbonicus TaxID=364589 RepID=A0A8K1LE46_9PASS|nr:hypothetical protein HGM15179_016533 [Zosterops borbonicus]
MFRVVLLGVPCFRHRGYGENIDVIETHFPLCVVTEIPQLKAYGIIEEIVTQFASGSVRTVRGVDTGLSTPPVHTLNSIPAPQQLLLQCPMPVGKVQEFVGFGRALRPIIADSSTSCGFGKLTGSASFPYPPSIDWYLKASRFHHLITSKFCKEEASLMLLELAEPCQCKSGKVGMAKFSSLNLTSDYILSSSLLSWMLKPPGCKVREVEQDLAGVYQYGNLPTSA